MPDEITYTVDLKNAEIVGPDDRVILQCSDPSLPLEIVGQMQAALNAVFGTDRALVVVGDAMTVLVQRQRYEHDPVQSFTLTQGGEPIGEHEA